VHPELRDLILAYDAAIEASPERAAGAVGEYERQLADALERRPNLSRETLHRMIKVAHGRWLRAQRKDTTIPPSA